MGCVDSLHLNDVGTSLEFEITECDKGLSTIVDLSSAILIEIRFEKPDGTHLDVIGSIYTGGANGNATDGIVQYITEAGDIDTVGKWKAQVTITFPSGIFNSTVNKTIKVLSNL